MRRLFISGSSSLGYLLILLITGFLVAAFIPSTIDADGTGSEPNPKMESTPPDTTYTTASTSAPDGDGDDADIFTVLYYLLLPAVI